MSLSGKTIKDTYKSLIRVNDNTNGVDATAESCTDGAGNGTGLQLGTDKVHIQPSGADATTAFQVKANAGSQRFLVDTSNGYIKGGMNDYHLNTQVAEFSAMGLNPSGTGYHDLIPFGHNTGFGADITEANAIQWAKDALGTDEVTAIEASIANQITEMKTPTVASGVSW